MQWLNENRQWSTLYPPPASQVSHLPQPFHRNWKRRRSIETMAGHTLPPHTTTNISISPSSSSSNITTLLQWSKAKNMVHSKRMERKQTDKQTKERSELSIFLYILLYITRPIDIGKERREKEAEIWLIVVYDCFRVFWFLLFNEWADL